MLEKRRKKYRIQLKSLEYNQVDVILQCHLRITLSHSSQSLTTAFGWPCVCRCRFNILNICHGMCNVYTGKQSTIVCEDGCFQ